MESFDLENETHQVIRHCPTARRRAAKTSGRKGEETLEEEGANEPLGVTLIQSSS